MRHLQVPVFIAISKGTEKYDEPAFVVTQTPFSEGNGFGNYHWYRVVVDVPIQREIKDLTGSTSLEAQPVEGE